MNYDFVVSFDSNNILKLLKVILNIGGSSFKYYRRLIVALPTYLLFALCCLVVGF